MKRNTPLTNLMIRWLKQVLFPFLKKNSRRRNDQKDCSYFDTFMSKMEIITQVYVLIHSPV